VKLAAGKLFHTEQMALSPRQIRRRRRVLAKGRKHFIVYQGVLGFGGLMFISTILWEWHDQFRWHVPSPTLGLFIGISFILLVSATIGYFWAALMWDRIYSSQH
jgi:hypothetical protein